MISILMATFNGEAYVAEQIESILSQTVQLFKIYIRDDCSTDNTYQIIQSYAQTYPEKIFVSSNQVNSGNPKYNFIHMMIEHKDDYVMLCDQDDVWLPGKIEKTLAVMKSMEEKYGQDVPLLCYTDLAVVNETLQVLHPSFRMIMNSNFDKNKLNQLVIQNTLTGCTALYNRALADLIMEEPSFMVMHDWWLILVAAAFGKIGHSDAQTILYRQHSSNQIGAKNVRTLRYKLSLLLKGDDVKAALMQTYAQAQCLLTVYEEMLSPSQKRLLRRYSEIPKLPKVCRWIRVLSLGTLKNSFSRNVGHFLFI